MAKRQFFLRRIERWKARRALACLVLPAVLGCYAGTAPAAEPARLISVRRIWDQAPHNAFTDLLRHDNAWWCVFREGAGHVSPDGVIRVLRSADGQTWESAAVVRSALGDLRDPKLCLTPAGEMMLLAAAAHRAPDEPWHLTLAWFSREGVTWGEPVPVGEPHYWVWRVTWHGDRAYGIGYPTEHFRGLRLYHSADGRRFNTLVPTLFDQGQPNETSLAFLPDDTALVLVRRDGQADSAQLGQSAPPYTTWTWRDLGRNIGGPKLLRLPDGRLVAAGRLYDGQVRTSLLGIDAAASRAEPWLDLPSNGDSSYPGLVWHDNRLWISYYSSHEGRTSIYLAQIEIASP